MTMNQTTSHVKYDAFRKWALRRRKANTVDEYINTYIRFFKWLGERELTIDTVDDWITYLQGTGIKYSTIQFYIAHIRILFQYLKRKDELADLVVPMIAEVFDEQQWLNEEESRMLITRIPKKFMNGRDKALLAFMLDVGFRRGEVSALNREHVNFDKTTVQVHRLKKRGKIIIEHVSFRSKYTVDLLRYYLAQRKDSNPALFLNDAEARITGKQINRLVKLWGKRILERDIHAHTLRHSVASHVANATKSAVKVAKYLNISMMIAEQYIHVDPEELRAELPSLWNS